MTYPREQIIACLREAGLCIAKDELPLIERFAALIEQAAIERCAKLETDAGIYTKHDLAAAIRALGGKHD